MVSLLRRLPLAEGYETLIPVTGRPGFTAAAECRVIARESVTVPAGTFECFKVTLGVEPRFEYQWISADKNRYTVKIENPELDVELMEITSIDRNWTAYSHAGTGISLKAPEGWVIPPSACAEADREMVQIFPPRLKYVGIFTSRKYDGQASLREEGDEIIATIQKKRKDFTVRPESWKETTLAGQPALSFTADYLLTGPFDKDGRKMVEYCILAAKGSNLLQFRFRVNGDRFETKKADFDSIAASLNFNSKKKL